MKKLAVAPLVLALLASACTNSGDESTTSPTPTTIGTPLTTLPPTEGSSSSTTTTAPITTTTVTGPTNDCVVHANTTIEGYTQGCQVLGIEILAAEGVDPVAIDQMADRIFNMIAGRPDLIAAFDEFGVSGRVIGKDVRITRLPEFTEVYEQYPGTDWNRRGRSFPGTDLIPIVAGGEENLLCLEETYYQGEDNFVRTLAIAIRRFGLQFVDPAADAAIDRSYQTAIARGLWTNTLAEINSTEYWAEGTQSFFDTNLEEPEDRPPNSSHNHVDTRDELRAYDPDLYAIALSVYGDTGWYPECP
jgi:hypothetical protein